jgi:hypothetical protein
MDFKRVPRTWPWFCVPAWRLLGVVAGFAEPAAVAKARGPAVLPCDDVVVVADRRIAVRHAAGAIACLDEAAETGREEPCPGIHGKQLSSARGGVEPPQPNVQRPVTVVAQALSLAHALALVLDTDLPGPPGGDHTVARKPRRFAVALEQGAVGHDELDFNPRDPARCPRDAFDQVISHDLSAGPAVSRRALRIGLPGKRCMNGHAGGDREQGGQVRHGVRCRAKAHMPVRHGPAGTIHHGVGVQPIRRRPGCRDNGPVARARKGPNICGKFFVDGAPVRRGQTGSLLHQQRGAPLIDLAGAQGREGVGHLRDQGLRQSSSRPPRAGDSRRAKAI